MEIPVVLIGSISLAGTQVSENLFGPFLEGHWMKLAAILVSVGLAFGAWVMDLDGLGAASLLQVIVLGVFAGLGSNVVNGLLNRFAPTTKEAPLAGVLRPPPK